MRQYPVAKLHFPHHHFTQARYAQWARPLLLMDYGPNTPGGVTHKLQTFRNPNTLHSSDTTDSGYMLEQESCPAWTMMSQFIRPRVLGYQAAKDPYHVQKRCFTNIEYYDTYFNFVPELEYLILGAPQQLLLGGTTVLQYWKYLEAYAIRHH